ncbi:chorismate--pyruvate lyase family protein [Limnofasciculus baicalensis]|uniref:Chorismate pyruvate-lyase family protein n=1 Tax=Limnofasciculus baicalensis BBK-W-15 TaxID=2699891 RepID=A0AAE3GPR4_9CYAN|nr:chorismate pyruvate-lyase family protein [Limnofasciculus baicalensis]MCP2728420.1 chorismate pyruvate-lyase family protein [Limnofasciculus baicalensis BBK-W-15]
MMPASAINEKQINQYELMRPDLDDSLARNHIEASKLSPFQRILLTTDGTVTEILEAYLFEPMRIVKLSEEIAATKQDIPYLNLKVGNEVIDRKILLQGKISRKNFIYAESIIVPDRLEPKFRDQLLNSKIPIGKLWLEHRSETFKEIVDSSQEPAEKLSDYFQISKEDKMLSRTYRVFSNRQPIMMITEKFPASYFVKDF